jgi:hypothetical protein
MDCAVGGRASPSNHQLSTSGFPQRRSRPRCVARLFIDGALTGEPGPPDGIEDVEDGYSVINQPVLANPFQQLALVRVGAYAEPVPASHHVELFAEFDGHEVGF